MKVWVFCFEYAGIAKVGGLGEVSANQCKNLVNDPDLDLHVFMPSHGHHLTDKEKLHLEPLREDDGSKLVLKGHFDPAYFGLGYGDILHTRSFTKFQSYTDAGAFEVEIWKGILDDVPIYLLVGANPIADQILNDVEVYGTSTLNAKLGLFSLAMREYMRYCIFKKPDLIPSILHIHDHHPVAALLCCRQELNLIGKDIRTVITMHLLTWPRRELEFFWKSGVNNEKMHIQVGTFRIWRNMQEIFEMCQSNDSLAPTLEKIGCAVADRVIAVSETFMNTDIIPNCGGDIIRWKSDYTWNGCDWDYYQNLKKVFSQFQSSFSSKKLEDIKSWDLRKSFLTNILGNLPADEPRITSYEIKGVVSQEFKDKPYRPDGKVDSFDEDGPLVLVTGRVSPQKGVETIFDAIPGVISQIPNVRFIFLMVPTPYSLDDLRNYMKFARQYPKNVRFIFGIAGSIYFLAHLSADVYCCPSRWEPFGIVALEAMASKIPVVATYVGGLMESIIHLEKDPDLGTGLLCPSNDGESLKFALVSLLTTMNLAELNGNGKLPSQKIINQQLNQISHLELRKKVEQNLQFGEQIRRNAYNRVNQYFRWKTVSQKLKQIYLGLTN